MSPKKCVAPAQLERARHRRQPRSLWQRGTCFICWTAQAGRRQTTRAWRIWSVAQSWAKVSPCGGTWQLQSAAYFMSALIPTPGLAILPVIYSVHSDSPHKKNGWGKAPSDKAPWLRVEDPGSLHWQQWESRSCLQAKPCPLGNSKAKGLSSVLTYSLLTPRLTFCFNFASWATRFSASEIRRMIKVNAVPCGARENSGVEKGSKISWQFIIHFCFLQCTGELKGFLYKFQWD